ncbi:MAG: hypothetical protein WCF04_02225 [Candidatus Nanopelagicales bacterium]
MTDVDSLLNAIRQARLDTAFSISVRSGRLWLPFDEFHARAEQLLSRPIPTHELAQTGVWHELTDALIAREGDTLW